MSRGVEHGGFCRTRRVRRRVPGAQAFAMDSRRFGGRKMSLFPAWAWVGFTGLIVFLLALIFAYFAMPYRYQYRVLLIGIIGALILRGFFIAIGAELLDRYGWMVYVFGVFLIYTGIRLALHRDAEVHPERNPVLRLV